MKLGKSPLKYDEKSDEWIESYDSYSAEDEFEDEVLGDNFYDPKNSDREKSSSDNDDNASDNDDNDEGDMLSVENKLKSNPGWADAMAKILKTKKPANKKAFVLSKAKKIKDVKPKKVEPELDFEIVGAENEENVKPNPDELDDKGKIFSKKSTVKECEARGRVKPSILDKDYERSIMKIATKGVVQLFNAVRQQQKTVDKTLKRAGKSELKRERILESIDKKKHLNAITGSVKSIPINNEIKYEEVPCKQKCTWNVLRDDFMMGANLKDWDKKE